MVRSTILTRAFLSNPSLCQMGYHADIASMQPAWIRTERDTYRQPPLFMILNRYGGLCWCGSIRILEPSGRRTRITKAYLLRRNKYMFCSEAHSEMWMFGFCALWGIYRMGLLEAVRHCELCGNRKHLEVDHVRALCNGGSMWDAENHRVLCSGCHKIKTAADLRKRRDTIPKNLNQHEAHSRT